MKFLQSTSEDMNYSFCRGNYILLAIGFVILVIGFCLLAGGAAPDATSFYPNGDETQTPEIFNFRRLTLAPIVIILGFVFEIFAILWKPKSTNENK